MSTLTADPPTTSHAATPPAAAQVQPTFAGVVRGEWIKLLSLRSTWWALASTAAVITLVALAAAASLNAMADDPALAPGIEQMHGAEVISSGFHFGMLTIAVLGALLITGEYATGLIRSTFAAVPTRIPVLAAKALTLVVLTAAVTLVSVTLSYFLTMPRLSQYDLVPALDDPGTWRVFGGTLYSLISAALFSLGVGTLLRSTAASLTAALTVLLLLPGILSFIRLDWVETIVSYLPLPASSALLTTGAVETQGAYLSAQASLIALGRVAEAAAVTDGVSVEPAHDPALAPELRQLLQQLVEPLVALDEAGVDEGVPVLEAVDEGRRGESGAAVAEVLEPVLLQDDEVGSGVRGEGLDDQLVGDHVVERAVDASLHVVAGHRDAVGAAGPTVEVVEPDREALGPVPPDEQLGVDVGPEDLRRRGVELPDDVHHRQLLVDDDLGFVHLASPSVSSGSVASRASRRW